MLITERPQYCAYCGSSMVSGAHFCAECGGSVSDMLAGSTARPVSGRLTIRRRYAAVALDAGLSLLLVVTPGFVVGFWLGATGHQKSDGPSSGALLLVGLVVALLAPIVCEAFAGATFGRRVLGLQSEPMGWRRAIGHGLARIAMLLLIGWFTYASVVFSADRRSLHDMIAGTKITRADAQ